MSLFVVPGIFSKNTVAMQNQQEYTLAEVQRVTLSDVQDMF